MVTELVCFKENPWTPAGEAELYRLALIYAKARSRARDRLNLAYRNQLTRNRKAMGRAVSRYLQLLSTMGRAGLAKPRGKTAAEIAANALDWDKAQHLGERMLLPALLQVALAGGESVVERDAYMLVKAFRKQEPVGHYRELAGKWAADRSGTLITAINEETLAGIRGVISQGLLDYEHPREIARGMRGMIGLNERQAESLARRTTELAAAHPQWTDAHMQQVLDRQADKMLRYRANMISRTETAASQGEGILKGFEEAGVELVEFVADPTACEDCLALDGEVFAIEEAHGLQPLHPNCECCWAAVQLAGAPAEELPPAEDPTWYRSSAEFDDAASHMVSSWKGGGNNMLRKVIGDWGGIKESDVLFWRKEADALKRLLVNSQKNRAGAWSKDIWRGLKGVSDDSWKRINGWRAGDVVKIDLSPSGWTTNQTIARKLFSREEQNSLIFHLKGGRQLTNEIDIAQIGGFRKEAEVIMGNTEFKITKVVKETSGRLFFELEELVVKRDFTADRATALALAMATDWRTANRRKARARRLKKQSIKPYHRAKEE